MPWRAMSIMPLLVHAPTNTPAAATNIMRRNDAAREPTAEVRKLTASLLTPTERSKVANKKRKMTIPGKIMSIRLRMNYTIITNHLLQITAADCSWRRHRVSDISAVSEFMRPEFLLFTMSPPISLPNSSGSPNVSSQSSRSWNARPRSTP